MAEVSKKGEWKMDFSCVAQQNHMWDSECSPPGTKEVSKVLKEWIMSIFLYVPRAQNVEVINKQLTFLFHAYDAMLAHTSPQAVTNCTKLLANARGEKDPLTSTRIALKLLRR